MSGRVTVLLVDDHAIVRSGVRAYLDALADLQVVGEAASGEEAVRLAAELAPDVVLMDLAMPGMDGVQAYTEIRNVDPDVKVVLSSGFSAQEIAERFRGKGLAGFIQKPYELEALQAKLREVLTGSATRSRH